MDQAHYIQPSIAISQSSINTALEYSHAGLSVIPIKPDGSKRPALSKWERFQTESPSEAEIRSWWKDGTKGFAIIGGAASGNLECIDFDRGDLFTPWCDLVETQAPGLVARLCVVRTPRDPAGFHIRYRCRVVEIAGNTKLCKHLEPTQIRGSRALKP